MASHPSYPRTRLYVEQPLAQGVCVTLGEKQAHYLTDVLRLGREDGVALFNGQDGEWRAEVESSTKKSVSLAVGGQLRPQAPSPDLWLLAAPLKGGKTESVVEKATELGIARFQPVATQFTVVDRINETRLRAIAVEASEQCERLDIPTIAPLMPLAKLLGNWPAERRLIYGDESGAGTNARDVLPALAQGSHAVLIGPEGGFSKAELELLRGLPYVTPLSMGPRIMRADTAAFAALALVQAWCGDWQQKPAFRNE